MAKIVKQAHDPYPVEFQGNRPYSEVRSGVGDNVPDDVLMLHDNEEEGGFIDDEVNATEPKLGKPKDPKQRGNAQPLGQ